MRRLWRLIAAALLASTAPACGVAPERTTAASPRLNPTFADDIAPLLHRNCSVCHHPGGSGPFPLLTYEDARKRASQIAEVTRSRFMPPWLPEPGYGRFRGERRLTEEQIASISAWVQRGAPLGEPDRVPSPPSFPADWELGPPDLVLEAEEAYTLPSAGRDVFRNFVFPVPLSGVRYVSAVEISPGNKRVVHHANLLLDRSGEGRRQDAAEPGAGFEGMDLTLESERFEPQTHFLFWKPGSRVEREPPGMAWMIDGRTDLILNMHLQPSGKPEPIRPSLGLYFADSPPDRYPMLIQLENDRALDIPPGVRDFTVSDDLALPVDVQVLGIYPHAHYLGQQLEAWATLPDGSRRWLIRIRDWDFNWQGVFRYLEPLHLPRGTRLSMRYRYDNSSENVQNPYDPPRRVTAGNQSTDEMAHLWLQVLPDRREDQFLLQEALMRHRLERYPGDAVACANLGSVLQLQGRLEEAIVHYRRAVELSPDDAVTLNSLGAALLASGRSLDAIPFFQRAIRQRADYTVAHFNLASVLLAAGRFAESVEHLQKVVQQQPDDFEAQARLGFALAEVGRLDASLAHYRQALRIRPEDAEALNDLGTVLARSSQLEEARLAFQRSLKAAPEQLNAHANLAMLYARTGDLKQAIEHFSRVVELDPDNADAHNNLGIALAQAGRMREAVAQFERAVQLAPGHPQAGQNLSRARAQLGNP